MEGANCESGNVVLAVWNVKSIYDCKNNLQVQHEY